MTKITLLIVLYLTILEICGGGDNFDPPERKKSGDPRFFSVFLKFQMIVHEIKTIK